MTSEIRDRSTRGCRIDTDTGCVGCQSVEITLKDPPPPNYNTVRDAESKCRKTTVPGGSRGIPFFVRGGEGSLPEGWVVT